MTAYELVPVGYQPTDPVIEANVKKAERSSRITRIFGAVITSVGLSAGATGLGFSIINSSGTGGLVSVVGAILTVGIGLKMYLSSNLYDRATLSRNIQEFANISLPDFAYVQKKGKNFNHIDSLQNLGLASAQDAQTMRHLCERYKACCWSLQSNVTSVKCDTAKTTLQQMEQEWDNLKTQLLNNAGIQV